MRINPMTGNKSNKVFRNSSSNNNNKCSLLQIKYNIKNQILWKSFQKSSKMRNNQLKIRKCSPPLKQLSYFPIIINSFLNKQIWIKNFNRWISKAILKIAHSSGWQKIIFRTEIIWTEELKYHKFEFGLWNLKF